MMTDFTQDDASWADIPRMFRQPDGALPPPWREIFGPLRRGTADEMVVVGQFGQSIDARIATATGSSHYINGPAGLAHLHRLRALVDAIVVGVGTALADDPQLTVRRVAGPSPARVVLDPAGRLPRTAHLFAEDGIRRFAITREGTHLDVPAGVETIALPSPDRYMAPAAILGALAKKGFRRILIEGGADTVSRFLAAGCLDRLHVVIAPIIIGAGRSSVTLPPIDRVDQALRTEVHAHSLGQELLLDCDLSALRKPVEIDKP
jgi:diaminohydroxyphosphoribosylaminopyrimidine deaminase/5-amino-6-(5-phosphoribosylamino)uracil reductase